MKRAIVLAAILALSLGATPSTPPAGLSYDQVTFVTRERPIPQASDFEKTFSADLATLKAGGDPSESGLPRTHVMHYAWFGKLERYEDLATGLVVITRPDDNQVIVVNAATHSYTVSPNAGRDIYSVRNGRPVVETTPGPGAPTAVAAIHIVTDNFPDLLVGNVVYKGIAGRFTETVTTPACGYAQQLSFFAVFYDPSQPDPQATGFYAPWITHGPTPLSQISRCTITLPDDALAQLAAYPHFLLYSMVMSVVGTRDMTFSPLPTGTVSVVTMRGHVAAVTSADPALFEPPAGYVRVPSTPGKLAP